MKPPVTPMLEKVSQARRSGHSEALGEFLEWYREQPEDVQHLPVNRVLATYFGIDEAQAERETRLLLDYLRNQG